MLALRILSTVALFAFPVCSIFQEYSFKPNLYSKRTFPKFVDWPREQADNQRILKDALPDAIDLVAHVADSYDKYKPIWDKYFPESDHDRVKAVWQRIVSDPTNPGTGEDRLKDCHIIGWDLSRNNRGGDPCAKGNQAYTIPIPPKHLDPGQSPDATLTYFCPAAFVSAHRYSEISCADLGDTVSVKMDFLGATIVHEFLHNKDVGQAAIGPHIEDIDESYGPTKTRNLRNAKPEQCVVNADNYTWLALEVLWTKLCLHPNIPYFKDPDDVTGGDSQPPSPQQTEPAPPTPHPEVRPADPPAPPNCVPAPEGKYRDAHETEVKKVVDNFCQTFAADTAVEGPDVDIKRTLYAAFGPYGTPYGVHEYSGNRIFADVYDLSVQSVKDCPVPDEGFNLDEPVGGHKCSDILYHAWKDCKFEKSKKSNHSCSLTFVLIDPILFPFSPCFWIEFC